MMFWQKAFFLTLMLFLLAFNVLGYTLLERSYSLNKENAAQAAQTEYQIIEQSVSGRILHLSALYTELNPENLKGMIAPYANFYSDQRVYLGLLYGETVIFNSHPFFIPPAITGQTFYEADGRLICVVGSELAPPLDSLRLVYMKDTSALLKYRTDMVNVFIKVSVTISLILAVVMLFMLVRLTRPFRKLSSAAESIAQGEYDKRAFVHSKDEIGQFAHSFNLMAEKVEGHIGALTQMSESRERFINDLAHETRTPITAIMGYAELLSIGNISEQEREKALAYIINQSQRIQKMTSKLSDLAQMSHGSIEKTPVDIADIVESALATCSTQMAEKRVAFNKDIRAASVMGDVLLLESLLQNLIENAVKYSNDGGRIDIATYPENDGAVLIVSDNGKGMEKHELSKITEPFYRIDKSRSRTDGSVGLGLALCARICEIHNARFEIESQSGEGTKIKICFTTL